jgi:hypothetical protein
MRAILTALAMLFTALTATPAAARGIAGLEWLTGTWCGYSDKEEKVCLIFTPRPDWTVAAEWRMTSKNAKEPERSFAVFRVEKGRVLLHSDDQDSDYGEVSRGPGELVMEAMMPDLQPDDLKRVRYRVVDGDLAIDFTYVKGSTDTGRYRRED